MVGQQQQQYGYGQQQAPQGNGYGGSGGYTGEGQQNSGPAKASGKMLTTLHGHISSDVVYKPGENGNNALVEFTAAVNFVKKGQSIGCFVRCTVWGNGSNDNYLRLYTDGFRKRMPITVSGSITMIDAYLDKNNQPKVSVDMRVSDLLYKGDFLDQGQQQQGQQQYGGSNNYEQMTQAPQYAPQPMQQAQYAPQPPQQPMQQYAQAPQGNGYPPAPPAPIQRPPAMVPAGGNQAPPQAAW